jgi:hypothetical protein
VLAMERRVSPTEPETVSCEHGRQPQLDSVAGVNQKLPPAWRNGLVHSLMVGRFRQPRKKMSAASRVSRGEPSLDGLHVRREHPTLSP